MTAPNQSPVASFASSCLGLTCYFTDQSTDADGSVVAWSWGFGDGNSSTEQHPIHAFAAGGTYTVTLTVTDDLGVTGTVTGSVVLAPSAITLGATGSKVKGQHKVDLNWSGATGANVEVYRDGVHLATVSNSGAYRDDVDARGKGTYVYQVCEVGATACSNSVTVAF